MKLGRVFEFENLKFHDVIKCLSVKQGKDFTE